MPRLQEDSLCDASIKDMAAKMVEKMAAFQASARERVAESGLCLEGGAFHD